MSIDDGKGLVLFLPNTRHLFVPTITIEKNTRTQHPPENLASLVPAHEAWHVSPVKRTI